MTANLTLTHEELTAAFASWLNEQLGTDISPDQITALRPAINDESELVELLIRVEKL
jgi:hypothetical protein